MITKENPLKNASINKQIGPIPYIMAILLMAFVLGLLILGNLWVWNEIFT